MAVPDPTEKWLPVVGFEGWYSVSNMGRVRREAPGKGTYPGRILTPRPDRLGYLWVMTSVDAEVRIHRIHRLVLLAFIGRPPNGEPNTNHLDGNRANNRLENLEWCSQSGNMIHAWATGLCKRGYALRGEDHPAAKLTADDVREIRRRPTSNTEIAREFGVTQGLICAIRQRRAWAWLN